MRRNRACRAVGHPRPARWRAIVEQDVGRVGAEQAGHDHRRGARRSFSELTPEPLVATLVMEGFTPELDVRTLTESDPIILRSRFR